MATSKNVPVNKASDFDIELALSLKMLKVDINDIIFRLRETKKHPDFLIKVLDLYLSISDLDEGGNI